MKYINLACVSQQLHFIQCKTDLQDSQAKYTG